MLNSHRLEVAKSLPFLAIVLLALAGGAIPALAATAATHNVVTCSDSGFRDKVLHATMPVLVDFSAPWCASCRALDESLGELSGSLKGKVRIVQVNVDMTAGFARRYHVDRLPTLILFQNGEEVSRLVGFRTADDIKSELGIGQPAPVAVATVAAASGAGQP